MLMKYLRETWSLSWVEWHECIREGEVQGYGVVSESYDDMISKKQMASLQNER